MRKEKIITLTDNDNTLRFKIRQMPATEQEKFIFKVLLLLCGKELGDVNIVELRKDPMKYIKPSTIFSALQNLEYEKVEPLINMLMSCCYRINGNMEEQCTPETINGYVESFTTLLSLKQAALEVNFDFFVKDGNSQDTGSEPAIVIGKTSRT